MPSQNTEQAVEQLFPWYASTQGPGLSSTLLNLAGTLLPMLNLMLAKYGVAILPDWLNMGVTLVVFAYFAIKAAIGYIKAKQTLGARLVRLQSANRIGSNNVAGAGQATSPR